MEKRDLERTKELLITAAEELMNGCDSADEVTSRAITQRAGVNLAMINYCFGSREELLYRVFLKLMAKAQNKEPELAEILRSEAAPAEKLIGIHCTMMKLMIENFNYSRAVTGFILMNRDISRGMDGLPFVEAHFAGRKTPEECRLITFQLTSLNELAVLRHKELREMCSIDLADEVQRKKFVTENIMRFLEG
ncbi:MAG: TetR/AcrR family transcriptional regulator [Ruminococcus sp.]|nr:TetR/AcrR family transcriptional regulator [Ruminococcus sp.]